MVGPLRAEKRDLALIQLYGALTAMRSSRFCVLVMKLLMKIMVEDLTATSVDVSASVSSE